MITSILSFIPAPICRKRSFYTQVIGLQQVFSSDTVRIFASPKGYIGCRLQGRPDRESLICAFPSTALPEKLWIRSTSVCVPWATRPKTLRPFTLLNRFTLSFSRIPTAILWNTKKLRESLFDVPHSESR